MPMSGKTRNPKLMVIAEGPGGTEDKVGEQMQGPAGQLQRAWMLEAGWNPHTEVCWQNSVRCGKAKPTLRQVRLCRPFVLSDIEKAKPERLVALGEWGGKSLTNDGQLRVKNYRNREITVEGLEHKPEITTLTYHPAGYLHGNEYIRDHNISDLRRLRRGVSKALPTRQLKTLNEIGAFVSEIVSDGLSFGLDIEWNGAGQIIVAGVTTTEHDPTWFLVEHPEAPWTFGQIAGILQFLVAGPDNTIIGHNAQGDAIKLAEFGIMVMVPWIDTVVLTKMIDENYPDHSLEHLAMRVLGWPDYAAQMRPYKKKIYGVVDYGRAPAHIIGPYCALDSAAPVAMVNKFWEQAVQEGWWPLFKMYMRASRMLARSSHEGFMVDMPDMMWRAAELYEEGLKLKKRFQKAIEPLWYKRREFRWKKTELSPHDDDLRDLLFRRMKFRVVDWTASGDKASVGAKVLQTLVPGDKTGIVAMVAGWTTTVDDKEVKHLGLRQLDTLLNRYFKRLKGKTIERWHEGKTAHFFQPGYNMAGAKTGRRSSSPNIQNIPKSVRKSFVSRWGGMWR